MVIINKNDEARIFYFRDRQNVTTIGGMFMPYDRTNDIPEDGIYLSRARQAIVEGRTANDEVGDKQAGDGIIQVPAEDLHKGLDIVRHLKEGISDKNMYIRELNDLEKIFKSMIED